MIIRRMFSGLALVVISVLAAESAAAQFIDIGIFAGASRLSGKEIGSISDGVSNLPVKLDNGFNFGFRFSFIPDSSRLGYEAGYVYSRTAFKYGSEPSQGFGVHRPFVKALFFPLPAGPKLRPYLSGGGHISNFVPPGQSALQGGGQNKFGVNYGGGLRYQVTERYSVRADLSQYLQGKPFTSSFGGSGVLLSTEATLGFALTF